MEANVIKQLNEFTIFLSKYFYIHMCSFSQYRSRLGGREAPSILLIKSVSIFVNMHSKKCIDGQILAKIVKLDISKR